MANGDARLEREIVREVCADASRVGLLYRAFSRIKDRTGIDEKIDRKGYRRDGPRLQDVVGVRVTLYFADDLEVLKESLEDRFALVQRTVDLPKPNSFGPTRINLVFRLRTEWWREVGRTIRPEVDSTFEVQIRTVLAEGWHEVEHDLRYKSPSDWEGHDDLSRALNGVVATLETCDFSMLRIFDTLSYRHYQEKAWDAMIRHKYRLRFAKLPLSAEIAALLDGNASFAKALFRLDRTRFLREMISQCIAIPCTLDNVVFVANWLYLHEPSVCQLMTRTVAQELISKGGCFCHSSCSVSNAVHQA